MIEEVQKLAHELRLFGIHRDCERRCQRAESDQMSAKDLLKLLLEDEKLFRQERKAKMLATRAKFRSSCYLEDWDDTFQRGINKAKIKDLAQLNFYYDRKNLLIEGKTGVGKTHLATAIGHRLCSQGISTKFYSTNLFFEEVNAEKASGNYIKFIRKLSKIDTLILDDFGLRSYTHEEANVLQDLLEERYRKGSVITTSQVSAKGLQTLFKDPVIAESIVDRLRNPAIELTLTGESYRQKQNLIDPPKGRK